MRIKLIIMFVTSLLTSAALWSNGFPTDRIYSPIFYAYISFCSSYVASAICNYYGKEK